MNYKVILSYNGSQYRGWSRQPGMLTIEQTLMDVFKKLFELDVKLDISGRTDAGVHALNQVFNVKHPALNIEPLKLAQALNSQLPRDLYIKHVEQVHEQFHARYHCTSKTYLYLINTNQQYDVINHQQIYQYNKPLTLDKMQVASQQFIGQHNFLSYSTSELKDTIRTVSSIELTNQQGLVQIKVTGNGFLRNMVRMLVGSLIAFSEDKISLQDLQTNLKHPQKGKAMYKVPPCGLYLMVVYYN